MIAQDKLEKERADAKNAVEEYVYDMRDKLATSLEQYITEAVVCFDCFIWEHCCLANHSRISIVYVYIFT